MGAHNVLVGTVNLRSKGPGRKGKPLLMDVYLSSDMIFFILRLLGVKESQSNEKIWRLILGTDC